MVVCGSRACGEGPRSERNRETNTAAARAAARPLSSSSPFSPRRPRLRVCVRVCVCARVGDVGGHSKLHKQAAGVKNGTAMDELDAKVGRARAAISPNE